MLVSLNIPLRRDAPALPEGEPFYREGLHLWLPRVILERSNAKRRILRGAPTKPLTPGEVAAEGRRRGVSEGNRGGCRKADGEGANIKLTLSNEP